MSSSYFSQIGVDINGAEFDSLGISQSLSADGTIVAIGAGEYPFSSGSKGYVQIYQNVSGTWTQIGDDIEGEAESDCSGFGKSFF